MKQYEYSMFTAQKDSTFGKTTEMLNERGNEGWELVAMFDRDMCYVCCMKREKETVTEDEQKPRMIYD